MNTDSTDQLCRVCLQTSNNCLWNVFDNFQDSTIASILSQHFWFQVNKDDGFSECICQLCWTKTIDFHNFYKKVESLHRHDHSSIGSEIVSFSDLIKEVKQERCESPREATLEPDLYIVKNEETEPPQNLIDSQISKKSSDHNKDCCYDQNENTAQTADDDEDQYSSENGKTDETESNFSENECKGSSEEDALDESRKTQLLSRSEKNKEDAQIREFFTMKCDMCSDFKFETLAEARKHYRKDHKTKGHLNCCEKRFYHRYRIRHHIRYHLNPNGFRCSTCGRRLRSEYTLKIHMETHVPIDSRTFKCDQCPQAFTKSAALKRHVQNKHSLDEAFPCNICNKISRTKELLGLHIRNVHVTSLGFICEICARAYKTKTSLRNHMEKHSTTTTVEPKAQCNICGATLKNKAVLRNHLERHKMKMEVINCPQCNKVFQSKFHLKKHIQYVHGERRYQCALCDKAFKTATSLREHIAVHTNQDLYDCPYCDKKFKSNANMSSHRKKTHFAEWSRERSRKPFTNNFAVKKND